ncbi:MAG: mandelate racemase/muconate lactonizing enzyme family protein [Candidatus Thorarchaeota archaeon]
MERSFYPSWMPDYAQTNNKHTIIKLVTDNGIEGIATGIHFGDNRYGLGEYLSYYLNGIDPTDLNLVYQRLREASYLKQRFSWVEAAFYDIIAKAEDVPVWKLLGGVDKDIPLYWSTGSVCDPKIHSKTIKKAQQEGYVGVKLRIRTKSVKEDIKNIIEARSMVDKDFSLMVDANQAFRWHKESLDVVPTWNLENAIQFAQGVENQNIRWIEEPLDKNAYEDLAALREETSIDIAGAELVDGWPEMRMFLHFNSYDIYQPDIVFTGIQDTLKLFEAAKKRKLGFSPHTWSNGVGFWANMHVYAITDYSIPFEYPHEPGSWTPESWSGLMKETIVPIDGHLELPQEAGLATPLDWNRVKKFGTKIYSSN